MVLVADLPGSAAQNVANDIVKTGGRAETYFGDLPDEHIAQVCVQAAIDAFGRLDVFASNAGVLTHIGGIDTCPVETSDDTLRNNARSTFLMTKFAVPHLQKTRGNIVFTSSITAIVGAGELALYVGSKVSIHAFVMAVAMEQAKHGVRVNAVAPVAIATRMTIAGAGGPIGKELEQAIAEGAAMGRQGTTEELANLTAFLASDEASYVTDAVFVADGSHFYENFCAGLCFHTSSRFVGTSGIQSSVDRRTASGLERCVSAAERNRVHAPPDRAHRDNLPHRCPRATGGDDP